MKRMYLLCLLVLPLLTSCEATPPTSRGTDALISGLTSTLGVTEEQAQGGVGSILTLAQEKLAAGDFDKIAEVIPGSEEYLDMAKDLGAVTGQVGNLTGLNSALGRLGITPDQAAKFVPAVTDAVTKTGGPEVGKLLNGVLSG
jgi:Protein of unknown function VcgC/VcgE (DUF2780)